MDFDKYKHLKPNVGNPDADYERQMLIVEAATIVGEAHKVGYWIGRFGGPKSKTRVPDNLIVPMAKRAHWNGRKPASLLNVIINRWRTTPDTVVDIPL